MSYYTLKPYGNFLALLLKGFYNNKAFNIYFTSQCKDIEAYYVVWQDSIILAAQILQFDFEIFTLTWIDSFKSQIFESSQGLHEKWVPPTINGWQKRKFYFLRDLSCVKCYLCSLDILICFSVSFVVCNVVQFGCRNIMSSYRRFVKVPSIYIHY
jgi:hypothetical protein